MKPVYIFWTCGSIDEARRISRFLVQEKWVACANIIPWIESVFSYEGSMQTQQETKVLFKTVDIHYEEIRRVIKQDGSYEIPEVTQLECDKLEPEFENWLLANVRSK